LRTAGGAVGAVDTERVIDVVRLKIGTIAGADKVGRGGTAVGGHIDLLEQMRAAGGSVGRPERSAVNAVEASKDDVGIALLRVSSDAAV
jgi:hypothetical protein